MEAHHERQCEAGSPVFATHPPSPPPTPALPHLVALGLEQHLLVLLLLPLKVQLGLLGCGGPRRGGGAPEGEGEGRRGRRGASWGGEGDNH